MGLVQLQEGAPRRLAKGLYLGVEPSAERDVLVGLGRAVREECLEQFGVRDARQADWQPAVSIAEIKRAQHKGEEVCS